MSLVLQCYGGGRLLAAPPLLTPQNVAISCDFFGQMAHNKLPECYGLFDTLTASGWFGVPERFSDPLTLGEMVKSVRQHEFSLLELHG